MNNQKFVLNLHLEQNEELMAEVDGLLRERAKAIVREEAEKMLGGSIQEEAKRVAKNSIEKLSAYDWKAIARQAVRDDYYLRIDWRKIFKEEVEAYINAQFEDIVKDALNRYVREHAYSTLNGLVQADVIKAVIDAITKGKR